MFHKIDAGKPGAFGTLSQKAQQLYFIELIGCNVNLGNIAPSEVIAMEAMRVGLRGDTFHMFLDK